jgi:hypothetical protein
VRQRPTIGWLLAATLAGVMVGVAATSYQVKRLRAEVARLERSRAQLQENSEQLAEALRQARAPLAWRIHELEATLAAGGLEPPHEEPGAAPAIAEAAEPARSEEPIQVAAAAPPAPPQVTPELTASPEVRRSTASAPPPAAEKAAPSPAARSQPAPPPAVSAPPPVALPAARSGSGNPCRSLAEPEFALDSLDQAVRRFEGRLVLRVDASGPDLVMHLGDDTSHSLAELPLHASTVCGGLAYIVSVCVAERDPFEVRGVISPADSWHQPCREILRARAIGNP